MTDKFPTKTYECQWQVVSQPVGQYGESVGAPTVLSRWSTREEAVADRPNHGRELPSVMRWVPHKGNGYQDLNIVYREVLVDPDRLTAERDAFREALCDAAAHLAAAISLLERGGKKGAPSDKMFAMMLDDYRKSSDRARTALNNLTSVEKTAQ